MRGYSILLAFLFVSSLLSAQQKRDYYVTVNADTVFGRVNINKDDFDLTKFKKPGGNYETLSGEVIGFYDAASQRNYVRLEIIKHSSSFHIEEITGPVKLLVSARHYYLVDKHGNYVEALRDKKLTTGQYGNTTLAIKNLLTGCPSIGDKEIRAVYSENEIVYVRLFNLVRNYNHCMEPTAAKVAVKKKKSVFFVEAAALAGVGEIKPSVFYSDVFKYAELKNSSFTQFQGRIKVGYAPRKNKWNFVIGYSRSSYHDEGTNSRLEGDLLLYQYIDSWDVSLRLTDISFGLEYCIFLTPRFSVYPTVGHSMVKTDIEEFYLKEVRALTNGFVLSTSHHYVTNDDLQNDFDPSFFYGLGVEYKITGRLKSILEFVQYTPVMIRFNRFNVGDNSPDLEFKRNNLRLGLSFMLVKD